jgi:type I restriction enzyme S subunit
MRKKWPKVQIGQVLRQRKPDVTVTATELYQFAGVYSFGRGVFRGQKRQGSEFSYNVLTQLREGEFLYPKLMAWEGAFGVVPPTCDKCYVSPEFPVFEIDESRLSPRFLGFYFQIPRVWESVSGGSTGTNVRRRRLNPVDFLKQEIPLPPLAEQRRVVARIEELGAQIHEARTLRRQAAEEAETLLVAMAHRADLDQAAKEHAGWKRKQLSEVLQLVDDPHKVESGRAYPNLGIYSFGRGLFHKPPIDGLVTSATTLRRVKAGQFIYSRLFAFEGAYGMVTDEFDGAFVSQEYPTFECNPLYVRADFLSAYFKPALVWKAVAAGSKGLGDRRQRVQPAQVLSHYLWIPPMKWQDCLAEVKLKASTLKLLQAETSSQFNALHSSVLDKAFSGEL